MKRRFFIFPVIAMVVMAMSFVGCDKNETIEPDSNFQEETILPPTGLKSSYSYNGNSAATYALNHTNNSGSTLSRTNYNNLYLDWADDNADCANFVSQCLKEGGFVHKNAYNSSTSDYSWWYCQGSGTNVWPSDRADDYTSTSWVQANKLHRFLLLNYSLTTQFLTSTSGYNSWKTGLQKGDVIFFDYSGNGIFQHVMIVTYSYSGTIKVSGHTWNQKDENLWNVVVDNFNDYPNCKIQKIEF